MGMRSESSSPLHSNFLDAATARFRAGNTLNMGGYCPKRGLRARFNAWCGALPLAVAIWQQSLRRRRAPAALRSVCLIPVAANSYIDFKGHRQCRRLRHVDA